MSELTALGADINRLGDLMLEHQTKRYEAEDEAEAAWDWLELNDQQLANALKLMPMEMLREWLELIIRRARKSRKGVASPLSMSHVRMYIELELRRRNG